MTDKKTPWQVAAEALRRARNTVDLLPYNLGGVPKASVLMAIDEELRQLNAQDITDPTKPTKPVSIASGEFDYANVRPLYEGKTRDELLDAIVSLTNTVNAMVAQRDEQATFDDRDEP